MYFSATVPVQYMSCWTGLNVFDHVRSYDNPFQQTDNHMELYQKLCARVNSRIAIFRVGKLEFRISLYEIKNNIMNTKAVKIHTEFYSFLSIQKIAKSNFFHPPYPTILLRKEKDFRSTVSY